MLGVKFRVRLSNLKVDRLSVGSASPPFCVRGNMDGRGFNTEYFHGTSMSPMWAFDLAFEYDAPSMDSLRSKYLLLELYGGEEFLGLARIDLMTLANSPPTISLDLVHGSRCTGGIQLEAAFMQWTTVTVRIGHLSLSGLPVRGYENSSPYLTLRLSNAAAPIESSVATNASSPQWSNLPPMHLTGTFDDLNDATILCELKHSRNGYTVGPEDPIMASFGVPLGGLPLGAGCDGSFPIRQMIHSLPSYPYPFSAQLIGSLELFNVHRVVQGGRSAAAAAASSTMISSRINVAPQPTSTMSPRSLSPPRSAVRSPARQRQLSFAPAPDALQQDYIRSSTELAAPPMQIDYRPRPTTVTAEDIEVLERVCDDQSILLEKVTRRLEDVRRKKAEIQIAVEHLKERSVALSTASASRREALDAELRAAMGERQRLDDALNALHRRRLDEKARVDSENENRARARMALEEEQREALAMQQRVLQLREEMQRHLAEEEHRYQLRVREAEDARRKTRMDSDALNALEARLSEAESRFRR